jgi:hypothetical protein
MRTVFQIISWASLVLTILPAILFFAQVMDLDRVKLVMFLATIVWFVATPMWMGRKEASRPQVD